ncbi:diadenylate cyclase [Elusimicrobiota bacterium]
MINALVGTLSSIRIIDVLDIIFVSVLVYFILLWFKKTRAAFVARGILIFTLVYLIARQSGMVLTTWIFQGVFAVALVALLVIFQDELRSFFERLAVWSVRRKKAHLLTRPGVEMLVRSIGRFSKERIGALIVIKGRDPLERHIDGGEKADAAVSEALLQGIFEPASDCHDGAVVIDSGRLLYFAAHLPLSKNFSKLSGVGTRHTAALGLSERSDAMCVVVSEGKGKISIARDGDIFWVPDLQTLEQRISQFAREKDPPKVKHTELLSLLKMNGIEKGIAIAFAFGLWLVFAGGFRPMRQDYQIPVNAYNIRSGLEIGSVDPNFVRVTIEGLKRDMDLLIPSGLSMGINMRGVGPVKQRVEIHPSNLKIPDALRVIEIDPRTVEIILKSMRGRNHAAGASLKHAVQ